MVVNKKGKYKVVKDIHVRTSHSTYTITAGKIIYITQIDEIYKQVIGPEIEDWTYWELPIKYLGPL